MKHIKIYVVNEYAHDDDDEYCIPHTFLDKTKAEQFLSKFMYDGDIRMAVKETTVEDDTVDSFLPNILFNFWFYKDEIYAKFVGISNVDKQDIVVRKDGNYILVEGTLKPMSGGHETQQEFSRRVEVIAVNRFKNYMKAGA